MLAMPVLEAAGQENPGLIASLAGLCGGVAWSGEGSCACLTGGACVLSYFTGQSPEQEENREHFADSLREYLEWFSEKMEGRITCMEILNRDMGNRLETCPEIIAESYEKLVEILEERNLL